MFHCLDLLDACFQFASQTFHDAFPAPLLSHLYQGLKYQEVQRIPLGKNCTEGLINTQRLVILNA